MNSRLTPGVFAKILVAVIEILAFRATGLDHNGTGRPDSTMRRWVQGEILVRFHDGTDPNLINPIQGSDLDINRLPASLKKLHTIHHIVLAKPLIRPEAAFRGKRGAKGNNAYVFQFGDSKLDVQEACAALVKDGTVEYAEPNYLLYPKVVPNDPYFSSSGSWGQSYDDQWGLKLAHLSSAWDLVTATNEIVVAVLDSGVDFTHPEFTGRIAANGWNYINQSANPIDDNGHGTFCSGIIAAGLNNATGISGIARYVKILPIKFLPASGGGSTANAVSGIYYAVSHGARVLNMSFGGDHSGTLETAINDAHNAGLVLVAAGGNDSGVNLDFPANYRNVVAVGATDHADHLADFSNYGPKIEISAPGGESGGNGTGDSILSVRATGTAFGISVGIGYCRSRGTSFSSPFVCGVIALMLNQRPQLENEEVRQILRVTADDIQSPGWDFQTSYGRVNAAAALQRGSAVASLITSPVNFAVIGGTLNVQGLSRGTNFHHFLLERGLGQTPTNWIVIVSNNVPVTNGTLGNWDTTLAGDGTYTLRIRSLDNSAASFEDRVVVTVSNFDPPYHTGWPHREYGANKEAPVLADLDGDGQQEAIWGIRQAVVVVRQDGTPLPGWPQPTADVAPAGPPSVADLDGDGIPEVGIIVNDYHTGLGQISIWHANGSTNSGWPKSFFSGNPWVPHETSPVFADIDNNHQKEVIWCSSTAQTNGSAIIHVDDCHGSPMPGWPITLPAPAGHVYSSPAVGDIDGDGFLDIAVTTENNQVFLFHHNGTIFPGWPIVLGSGSSISGNPAFADVDHDGQLEVFAETYYGSVGIYKVTGQPLPGWPQEVGWLPRSPAFGDLDEDGRLEIALGTQAGVLYVFHDDGTQLQGWPQSSSSRFYSPIIADLDHDGHLDLACSDGNANVYGWNAEGGPLFGLGFPMKAPNFICSSAPLVADVKGDGNLGLLVLGSEDYFMWDLPSKVNPSRMDYPMLMGDATHQSRYKTAPRLTLASPAFFTTNQASELTIRGDFFLKGMRVFLGTNSIPVLSESVTSIVVNLPSNLTPRWYDLTVFNVNSYATTLSNAVDIVSSLEGDDDADSLSNGWEITYGLDPHDNGSKIPNNGAAGDPDHDGMQNWQEQIAGTDPTNPDSVFKISSAGRLHDGDIVLSWLSVPGRRYTVYCATNLSGEYAVLQTEIHATPPVNTYTNSQPGSCPRFYRLGVQ